MPQGVSQQPAMYLFCIVNWVAIWLFRRNDFSEYLSAPPEPVWWLELLNSQPTTRLPYQMTIVLTLEKFYQNPFATCAIYIYQFESHTHTHSRSHTHTHSITLIRTHAQASRQTKRKHVCRAHVLHPLYSHKHTHTHTDTHTHRICLPCACAKSTLITHTYTHIHTHTHTQTYTHTHT